RDRERHRLVTAGRRTFAFAVPPDRRLRPSGDDDRASGTRRGTADDALGRGPGPRLHRFRLLLLLHRLAVDPCQFLSPRRHYSFAGCSLHYRISDLRRGARTRHHLWWRLAARRRLLADPRDVAGPREPSRAPMPMRLIAAGNKGGRFQWTSPGELHLATIDEQTHAPAGVATGSRPATARCPCRRLVRMCPATLAGPTSRPSDFVAALCCSV